MNMLLGLCVKTRRWPSVLSDPGYKAQLIGQSVGLQSAQKAVPDAVSASDRMSHAVVADCKSGDQLTPKDLQPGT